MEDDLASGSKTFTSPAKKKKKKPGTSRVSKKTKQSFPDAISLLKQDHATLKELLTGLENTTESAVDRRSQLLKQIETEIKIHSRIEEEIFYPAFKDAVESDDEHIYHEALEEHHLVVVVLPEIKATTAGSEKFSAKAKVLKDLIEHHAEEEETEMFPKALKVMDIEQLRQIGDQLQGRKQQLQADMLTRIARNAGGALGKVMKKVARKRAG